MRSLVVLAGLGLLAATAPAATASPGPGRECEFAAVSTPLDPAGTRYVGEVEAGPIVIAEGGAPRTGRVTCTIRANGDTHAAESRAAVTSLTTTGVVVLHPTAFEFVAADDEFVVICTSVEIDGAGTFYFDADTETWSTSPAVLCFTALAA